MTSFVTPRRRSRIEQLLRTLGFSALLLLPACNRGRHRVLEVDYVSAPQAILRDQVAAIFNRVGNVKNGERVEVLEHEKRFARVRTESGVEGWIELRFLVDQKTFDAIQKLTHDSQNDPIQAPGVMHTETNLHVTPGRDTEHLYQLASGAQVSILKRETAEKQPGAPPPSKSQVKQQARAGGKPLTPGIEDWYLVRDSNGRVGWVLARMVDVDVPLDIAQYAEGQRIVAFFVLDEVPDGDKKVPQYLCLLTEPHDGLPYDFDQIRVFTWNVRRHRYETAYREHGLNGVLPVTLTSQDFDKEGKLPVFIIRSKDDAGGTRELTYKLNTPIVRRVLAPGEVAPKSSRKHRP